MLRAVHSGLRLAASIGVLITIAAAAEAQNDVAVKPSNLPNPYRLVEGWPTLPDTMKGPHGHKWGEVIRVHLAPDGNIWVFQRCFNNRPAGEATCVNRGNANPPILEFSPDGKLLKSFGVGLFAHLHGFTVDKDGNIWTTDTNDEETRCDLSLDHQLGNFCSCQLRRRGELCADRHYRDCEQQARPHYVPFKFLSGQNTRQRICHRTDLRRPFNGFSGRGMPQSFRARSMMA